MDGETIGGQEPTQDAQDQAQQQGQEQQETQQDQSQVGGNAPDYEKQIAERDEKIASFEAQVADSSRPRASTPRAVTPALARPDSPTRVRPPTRARP